MHVCKNKDCPGLVCDDEVRSGQGRGYEDLPDINTGAQNNQHHLINAPLSSLVCD